MNAARRPQGNENPEEPFIPDFSEGAETGLYLALLELLDEGLIITGDEVVLEANSAACRLLGRDYRQIAGKPLADLFPSEKDFLDARARLFIQGEVRGSLRVALPDGGTCALGFVAAARIRPGIHALILTPEPGRAQDVGANAQHEATTTDTLWPRLAAALEQPVLVIDEAERVSATNAAALATLGLDRGSIIGHALRECMGVIWPGAGAAPIARLSVPGRAPSIAARILPGPKPGWRLLILPPNSRPIAAEPPVETKLRQDIDLKQLDVYFQPLIDARSGGVRAGEALLRWHHPQLGLIPFQRFADVARDAGQLTRMGDWVLQAACTHAAQWRCADGSRPMVTINVALEQLTHCDLEQRVRDALAASGLPASRLELDLDERVLGEDSAATTATLDAIAGLGVRLAIDDFGRGLVSIPRLKRLPLRALKLDPYLVREVGKSEESEAIVEAISRMAEVLGIEVLARGVESAAQQAFLAALGCQLQQGPLFGQPMTAEAFRDRLSG